jgi:hypothetical protein
MPNYTVIVTNNYSGCSETIEQVVSASTCTTFFVRIPENSTAEGPFNIYTGTTSTTPIYSAVTKNQLFSGLTISLNCP